MKAWRKYPKGKFALNELAIERFLDYCNWTCSIEPVWKRDAQMLKAKKIVKRGEEMTEYIKAANMEPRRARCRHLNPKIREGAEWAVAGITMILGTVVAVEIMAAVAAILM